MSIFFKKRAISIFLLIIIVSTVYSQKNNNLIIGFTNVQDSTKVFLQKRYSESIDIDSTYVIDGKFKFKQKGESKFYASIKYENLQGFIPFLVSQSAEIKIIDTGRIYKITNSNDNLIMENYSLSLSKLLRLSNEKISKSLAIEKIDPALSKQFYQEYLFYERKEKESIYRFIIKNKNSFASIITLYKYKSFFSKDTVGIILKTIFSAISS